MVLIAHFQITDKGRRSYFKLILVVTIYSSPTKKYLSLGDDILAFINVCEVIVPSIKGITRFRNRTAIIVSWMKVTNTRHHACLQFILTASAEISFIQYAIFLFGCHLNSTGGYFVCKRLWPL